MNSLFTRLLFLTAFLFCSSLCFSQNIDSLLSHNSKASSQEKIYIHFDKGMYALGDTVWFKAYLFTGSVRSKLSRNFYFELFNEDGKLLRRLTAPIYESTAAGSIALPAESKATGLYCRAYTLNMLKSDSDFIYTKQLFASDLKKTTNSRTNKAINAQFLPEGGDWVNDVPALIAFKMTDANGMPVNAKGTITSDNKPVTTFTTAHDGMGVFTIVPQEGKEYTAVWKETDGTTHQTVLPARRPQGVELHVSDIATGKKFIIFRTKQVDDADKNLLLVAFINNYIVYKAKIDLTEQEGANGVIPVQNLPSGILYVTLYNKNLKPLAERVKFINNHNFAFNADTQLILINKQKRGLNEIKLAIKDTVRSNVSVSVTDVNWQTQATLQDNIVSHLLLTGDLRGKIVNPYYYFSESDSAARNLDLVMLTHGWRRYKSENNDRKLATDASAENSYLAIDGKINGFNHIGTSAAPTIGIIAQSANSAPVILPLEINKNGSFFKDGLIFYGDTRLSFKFGDKALSATKLNLSVGNGLIDSLQIPPFHFNPTSENNLPGDIQQPTATTSNNHIDLRGAKKLKEVIIKALPPTQDQKLDDTYTKGIFSGGISKNFNVGDDPKALNNISVFQYLQNKIAGLEITDPLSLSPSVSWRDFNMYIFLDNQPSTTFDVRALDMGEFDYVKVFDPSQGGIFGVYGGVIAIYTKKGKGFNFATDKTPQITLAGYTPVREFYSPDYATAIKTGEEDRRTTLYWHPNIILDKAHQVFNIRFYNSDVSNGFKIIVEGINFDNKLIHIEKVL